jgi:hypothetical protein
MDAGKKKPRGPEIGLHQAKRLCQLDESKRLEFIAEGLPVILRSAQDFWQAAEAWARPKDFSPSTPQFTIRSTSNGTSAQKEHIEPFAHRPCRLGVTPSP